MSKWKKEFNILASEMDKREKFLSNLHKTFPKYEDCPARWQESWKAYEGKSWRTMPAVIRRLKSAAKKKCKL